MSETDVHGEAVDWESEDEDSDDSEEEEEEYTSPSQPPSSWNFDKDRHLVYLQMMYELLPHHYQSQEINRLTLAHFIISGLHFLGATDRVRLSLCFSLFSVSVKWLKCQTFICVSDFQFDFVDQG